MAIATVYTGMTPFETAINERIRISKFNLSKILEEDTTRVFFVFDRLLSIGNRNRVVTQGLTDLLKRLES